MSAYRNTTTAVLAGIASITLLAACGSETDDPGTTPVQTDEPGTSLTITTKGLNPAADEEQTATLTCDPVGGDLESRTAACEQLEAAATDGTEPFAAAPDDEVCLQVVEGPGEVTVTGTWNGTEVDRMFTQRNSCESDRFDAVLQLLGLELPR